MGGFLDALGFHRLGAGQRRLFEGLTLVGRVALHRLDQVGHEIVASLELDVDPAPGLVDPIASGDDRVALGDEVEDREDYERGDDDEGDGHEGSFEGPGAHHPTRIGSGPWAPSRKLRSGPRPCGATASATASPTRRSVGSTPRTGRW